MTSIGIIGAGMIANIHAESAARIGTNVLTVFDSRLERANEFAQKHVCEVEESFDAMLRRDDLDGVVIAVPNDKHAQFAIDALQAGKHVLLEKPMAMSLAQCDAIVEARNQSSKVLQMGFVCRFAPAAMKAKEIIESGTLGDIHHVQATLLRQRGIPGLGGWFTTKEKSGGGCLIDIGVHLIDLVMYLTSKQNPVRVQGKCTQAFSIASYAYEEMWSTPVEDGTFDVEDRVRAMVTDKSETTFQFDVAWATHLPEHAMNDGLLIEGTDGSLVVDLWSDEILCGYSQNGTPKTKRVSVAVTEAWDDAFDGEHRAFAAATANGVLDSCAGTGEDGRLVQQIVEAIYASDDQHKEIPLAE
jgi:predicted dehydrogenase